MPQLVPLTGRDTPACRNLCSPDRPEHPDLRHLALPITRGPASPGLDPNLAPPVTVKPAPGQMVKDSGPKRPHATKAARAR